MTTLKTWPPGRVDFMVSPSLPFQELWDDHLDWDGKGQLILYDGLCEVSRNVWRNSVGEQMTLSPVGTALYFAFLAPCSFKIKAVLPTSQRSARTLHTWHLCKGGIICHSEHGGTNEDRLDYKCEKQLPNSA